MIYLWLDDERPAPPNWIWVKTVEEAKKHLTAGGVLHVSLDHDLGACDVCLKGRTAEQWLMDTLFTEMPNCEHFGTGLTLVKWMDETGRWPKAKPTVHSRNAKKRAAMQEIINKVYG